MARKMNNMPARKKKKDKSNPQIRGKAGLGKKRAGGRAERADQREKEILKPTAPSQVGLAELAKLQEEKAQSAEQELDSDGEPLLPKKKKRKKKRKEQRPRIDRPVADESDEELGTEAKKARKGSVEFREDGSMTTETGTSAAGFQPGSQKLEYGSNVCLKGLQGSPELNGKSGKCLSWDAAKLRWHVRLLDGSLKLLKPENLKALVLEEGSRVRIQGLTGAVQLNGKLGMCRRWDVGKQRWLVILKAGTEKLLKPENLEVVGAGDGLSISPTVSQTLQICTDEAKLDEVVRVIKNVRDEEKRGVRAISLILVFCSSPQSVRDVTGKLVQVQLSCIPLHSEVPEARREHALSTFHLEGKRILVLTDDAATGICTKDVRYLVNYDFPASLNLYCNRLGNLGRQMAVAHSLFTRSSACLANDFAELLEQSGAVVDPALRTLASKAAT